MLCGLRRTACPHQGSTDRLLAMTLRRAFCEALIGILALASTCISSVAAAPPGRPIDTPLFGLNIVNLNAGAKWPPFPFHGWRTFDSIWERVEPRLGAWDFRYLDRTVASAEANNVELLLNLMTTPTWASARPSERYRRHASAPDGSAAEPSQLAMWERYVETLARRYKGRVRHYELWNEANVGNYYSGSVETLVTLCDAAYRILKRVDPDIVVVSPAFHPNPDGVGYLDRFLAAGGGRAADVIGFHFYVGLRDMPETMQGSIVKVKQVLKKHRIHDKPLWNTETGWYIANPDKAPRASFSLSEDEASNYLIRTYLLTWASGIERLYWYAWGHGEMGLNASDLRSPKQPALAFREAQSWLVGKTLAGCDHDGSFTWTCELREKDGQREWIIWNPFSEIDHLIPDGRQIRLARPFLGDAIAITDGHSIRVGPRPVLVK